MIVLCLVAVLNLVASQETGLQDVDCGSLPNPVNGQVVFGNTTVGSVATYSCEEGFMLSGVSSRICQINGNWTDSEPSCPRIEDHLFPFGELVGDQIVPPALDGSSAGLAKTVLINVTAPFFGTEEDTLFVSTNGLLSFRFPFTDFTPEVFPLCRFQAIQVIAPFWDDSDVRNGGQVYHRFSTDQQLLDQISVNISDAFGSEFSPMVAFIATWDRIPQFVQSNSVVNTFQAVLATDGNATYVMFLYRDIQWGDASTSVGFNTGDGQRGFNLPGTSSTAGIRNLTLTSNVSPDSPGVYYFRVDQFIQQPGDSCPQGFSASGNIFSNGTLCTDIDECSSGANNCDPNALCVNTVGSFFCGCLPGFSATEINGSCQAVPSPTLSSFMFTGNVVGGIIAGAVSIVLIIAVSAVVISAIIGATVRGKQRNTASLLQENTVQKKVFQTDVTTDDATSPYKLMHEVRGGKPPGEKESAFMTTDCPAYVGSNNSSNTAEGEEQSVDDGGNVEIIYDDITA